MHSQSSEKRYFWLRNVCTSFCLFAWNRLFPSGQNFVIFYIATLYFSSTEKIHIWLISYTNYRNSTCVLVLLLGETTLGKNTSNILAQNCTITGKGRLLWRMRTEQLSPMHARPYISLCFISTVHTDSRRQRWRSYRKITTWRRQNKQLERKMVN